MDYMKMPVAPEQKKRRTIFVRLMQGERLLSYCVTRRAIKLNEVPVQNSRPRTRNALLLPIVPNELSVPGCTNTCTDVFPESRVRHESAARVRSKVAAPPEPAVKFATVP